MFFRLLIFALLAFVAYRVVRTLLGNAGRVDDQSTYGPPDQVDDVMIKDPVCGIHFPKRDGVALRTPQEVLYFCSSECRDSYLAKQSKHS